MLTRLQIAWGCLAAGLAVQIGCATPGAPQPPSLDLPKPVADLEAARIGEKVTLTWTLPTQTTDKLRIRRLGSTVVCRFVQENAAPVSIDPPKTCDHPIATIPANALETTQIQSKSTVTAHFTDTLPADFEQQHPTGTVDYAIQVENTRGKAAGLSNIARVPLVPILPPPGDFKAQPSRAGILLTWTPVSQNAENKIIGYRIERTQAGGRAPDQKLFVESTSAANSRLLDSSFEWGKTYTYRIAAVTGMYLGSERTAQVQGAWSGPQTVEMRDVFPPTQPSSLQAVYTEAGTQRYIDLTWNPSSDADLAGYNVYRRAATSQPARINSELIKTPAYRDSEIAAGVEYFYSVSAVDLRGNESAKSAEASEKAPKQ